MKKLISLLLVMVMVLGLVRIPFHNYTDIFQQICGVWSISLFLQLFCYFLQHLSQFFLQVTDNNIKKARNAQKTVLAGLLIYMILILEYTLSNHCICNSLEACDICTCNKVITQTVLCTCLCRGVVDVLHNCVKLLVNLFCSPGKTH